jgi:hypothetical protein
MPLAPYRDPSWPVRRPRARPRRFHPARTLDARLGFLFGLTVYLLLAGTVEHVLVIALRMGLRMPSGCGCLIGGP